MPTLNAYAVELATNSPVDVFIQGEHEESMYPPFKSTKISASRYAKLEAAALEQLQPAYTLEQPERLTSPLIFASPHSGRLYPKEWLKLTQMDERELRLAEDCYVDLLFETAPAHGAPLLSANFPRSFVDVNRAAEDLPQDWRAPDDIAGPRTKAGLGVIPMGIAEDRPIYKLPPTAKMGQDRLEALYHPYHEALQELITAAQAIFGRAIVIDCHSMPGYGPMNKRRADFILGDAFGKACTPELIKLVAAQLGRAGYSVAKNHPYAGGYVTRHYGQPNAGTQVLQIEINRALYLNTSRMRKTAGFAPLQADMSALIKTLTQHFSASQHGSEALAAE